MADGKVCCAKCLLQKNHQSVEINLFILGLQVIRRQTGVLRVNCFDCLDRSNFVQSVVGSVVLDTMLTHLWRRRPELTGSKCSTLQQLFSVGWAGGDGTFYFSFRSINFDGIAQIGPLEGQWR
jgi:hypothetical protein